MKNVEIDEKSEGRLSAKVRQGENLLLNQKERPSLKVIMQLLGMNDGSLIQEK